MAKNDPPVSPGRFRGVPQLVLVVLVLGGLLSACGFQLRGQFDWPESVNPVVVSGLSPTDPFYLDLTRILRSAGVTVTSEVAADIAELRILALREQRRVLTVTGVARVGEYELVRILDADLRLPGVAEREVLGPLRAARAYVFDATVALSQAEREDELRLAMNRDLLRLLQLRIRAAADSGPPAGR